MSIIKNQHKWSQLRKQVIKRDLGCCQICGDEGTEVDHRIERRDGGTDDLDNLWLLCHRCHLAKTLKRSAEAQKSPTSQKPPSGAFFDGKAIPHDPTYRFPSPTTGIRLRSPFEEPS